ncbi:uncharacterized protein AMSG_05776 [Thecamonas trahens ATCC 50062]|uniref:Uncharacterized protein n=1 Tax=Thecamonas trahens ATCC 50062 TaxID=461836 RepID=A0A0L0DCF2_THETB|nr:hypothetical protein AMSG_05776 [Thecamonas trahens ATCC 50062]KNC50019.1 hypothetical protein AMSG_05776 [Thecamonas trahens ATCC 50062]|eukprot:XP_013757186.1 hypothetical protein AMSG_05776 [Thecamonas trahens ATCC 50062]
MADVVARSEALLRDPAEAWRELWRVVSGALNGVQQVVIVDGDQQTFVLDEIVESSGRVGNKYQMAGTVLVVCIMRGHLNKPDMEEAMRLAEASPWMWIVPTLGRTKDAADVEVSCQAVHLHYQLPLEVTFVVASQDGFASELVAHLRTLGREVELVLEWTQALLQQPVPKPGPSRKKGRVDASVLSARHIVKLVSEVGCDGVASVVAMGSGLKQWCPEGYTSKMFRRLLKDALELGWVQRTSSGSEAYFVSSDGMSQLESATTEAQRRDHIKLVAELMEREADASGVVLLARLGECVKERMSQDLPGAVYSKAYFRLMLTDVLATGEYWQIGEGARVGLSTSKYAVDQQSRPSLLYAPSSSPWMMNAGERPSTPRMERVQVNVIARSPREARQAPTLEAIISYLERGGYTTPATAVEIASLGQLPVWKERDRGAGFGKMARFLTAAMAKNAGVVVDDTEMVYLKMEQGASGRESPLRTPGTPYSTDSGGSSPWNSRQ